jgi:ATP-dependent protease Clp ATPase subunit
MERLMLDIMYEAPGGGKKKSVKITADMVNNSLAGGVQ